MKDLLLLAIFPLLALVLVLGWLWLQSKGSSRVSLMLKGLGICIIVETRDPGRPQRRLYDKEEK